jgi:hypothetical protein
LAVGRAWWRERFIPRTIENDVSSSMLGCAQRQRLFNQGEMMMTQSKSSGTQNKQSAHESEADVAKRQAGKPDKSSHDHMQRTKAGTGTGAGGGAKQKQNH